MAKYKPPLLGSQLDSLGEFIAAQRRSAELSLRQLAEQTGVSNPYLSQIERGLRKPSAEVLQQLAKALRVSAETLYVRAGILDPRDHATTTVEMAVLADPALTERQRSVLLDIYGSFVRENQPAAAAPESAPPAAATEDGPAPATADADNVGVPAEPTLTVVAEPNDISDTPVSDPPLSDTPVSDAPLSGTPVSDTGQPTSIPRIDT